MNDKIYPRLSIDHWKHKVELASAKRVLQEFKNMDNKFTKGPWIICDGDSTDSSDLITTNYRSVENNIVPIAEIETEFDGIIGTEQEANAHLIAAAPDMYEMIKEVADMQKQWYGYGMDTHIKLAKMAKKMELILAKARGEIT